MSLDALFAPRTVAVVGASGDERKLGAQMLKALRGFPGTLHAVNPRATEDIQGVPTAPSVAAIGATVDLAVLAVRAAATPAALEDCAAAGTRAALICSGGFGETGAEGRALQERVAAVARAAGIRVLGPNTSGFVNPHAGVTASFVPGIERVAPGGLAVVAQSGGVNHALAFRAAALSVGLRLGVGLGNAIDVDFADVLDHLAADELTTAVVLEIEGVGDGRRLAAAVRALSAVKPVVALKVGRADVGELSRSHTGHLTGSWPVARAALQEAGALVVEDSGALLDAGRALAAGRIAPAARPGVGVVSAQAGPALLVADTLRHDGADVPELADATVAALGEELGGLTFLRNPVDTGRPGPGFGRVLDGVAADPAVDALVVYVLCEPDAIDLPAVLGPFAARAGVPVLVGTAGRVEDVRALEAALHPLGVPVFDTPEAVARAAAALVRDARARRRGTLDAPLAPPPEPPLPGALDEHEAKALLEAHGLRAPRRRACGTREQAHAALGALRAPLAVKALDPAVGHKTDVGALVLGVAGAAALDAALERIAAALGGPPARGFLLEEMAPPGSDFIVGAVRDPAFGPAVVVGWGGVLAEALERTAVRLAPVHPAQAARMLTEIGLPERARGGGEPPERGPLVQAVCAVGDLLAAHPEIAELDVNPVRMTPDGLLALDALVVLDTVERESKEQQWIWS